MARRRRRPAKPLLDEHRALLLKNLPLIWRFASEKWFMVRPWGVELDDFVADLELAVLNRLPDFDPQRGKFSTFVWMIMLCRLKGDRSLRFDEIRAGGARRRAR